MSKYKPLSASVKGFFQAANKQMAPASKAKLLWGIAFSMKRVDLEEARDRLEAVHAKRLKLLEKIQAPEVILRSERDWRKGLIYQALRRALETES